MEIGRSEVELETIVSRIRRGEVDLQPDFQRGDIWDIKRRQRLVDSILREWYVPAVHVVRDIAAGPDIVLDGQQRLTAIRDFFDDKFPIDGSIEPVTERVQRLHGLKYSELPSSERMVINRFALPLVTLKGHSPGEPNELFFRLNQSYNLTPSEKRNALHGAARHQVKNLVIELGENLLRPEVVGFNNGRLAYDDIVARTCLAVERGTLRAHINNNVVERFYRESEFSRETLEIVGTAGRMLADLVNHAQVKIRFNKATLFTWLVLCYWVPATIGNRIPVTLLDKFETARRSLRQSSAADIFVELSPRLTSPLALYDDRASYRVTDVSSVLARDLAVYLFLQEEFGYPSLHGSDELLNRLGWSSETPGQQAILEFASERMWGELPWGGVRW